VDTPDLPILYVKPGCPWCTEVIDFLADHKLSYLAKNVSSDPLILAEMKQKSGQSKAPTLDWHGSMLADFGVSELKPFLRAQKVEFGGG
jgi:glutaredoxin 3